MAIKGSTKSKCGSTIPATCVTWQGGNIECLPDICTGASIQDIIEDLGSIVCDNFNIDDYDISCLLEIKHNDSRAALTDGNINSFQELLQLMIDVICINNKCCDNDSEVVDPEECKDNAPFISTKGHLQGAKEVVYNCCSDTNCSISLIEIMKNGNVNINTLNPSGTFMNSFTLSENDVNALMIYQSHLGKGCSSRAIEDTRCNPIY